MQLSIVLDKDILGFIVYKCFLYLNKKYGKTDLEMAINKIMN